MNKAAGTGGATLGDHFAMAAKRGHRPKPVPPPLPKEANRIWNTFTQLHAARPAGQFGISPITWSEIDAYCRVTATRLPPWEAEALRAIDAAFLNSRNDPPSPPKEPQP